MFQKYPNTGKSLYNPDKDSDRKRVGLLQGKLGKNSWLALPTSVLAHSRSAYLASLNNEFLTNI